MMTTSKRQSAREMAHTIHAALPSCGMCGRVEGPTRERDHWLVVATRGSGASVRTFFASVGHTFGDVSKVVVVHDDEIRDAVDLALADSGESR